MRCGWQVDRRESILELNVVGALRAGKDCNCESPASFGAMTHGKFGHRLEAMAEEGQIPSSIVLQAG